MVFRCTMIDGIQMNIKISQTVSLCQNFHWFNLWLKWDVLLWGKNFIRHYYIYYKHLQLTGSVLLMLLIPFYLYILSSNRDHVTMLRKVVGALPYSFHAIMSGSIFRQKALFRTVTHVKKILFSSKKKMKFRMCKRI